MVNFSKLGTKLRSAQKLGHKVRGRSTLGRKITNTIGDVAGVAEHAASGNVAGLVGDAIHHAPRLARMAKRQYQRYSQKKGGAGGLGSSQVESKEGGPHMHGRNRGGAEMNPSSDLTIV